MKLFSRHTLSITPICVRRMIISAQTRVFHFHIIIGEAEHGQGGPHSIVESSRVEMEYTFYLVETSEAVEIIHEGGRDANVK